MRSSFLAIVAALISVNLLCSVLAMIYPSGAWAVAAFICYMAFCAALFRLKPASFMLLSPLLFLRATEMVSGIPIEFGAYIDELASNGSATGGFTRLSALLILFFSAAAWLIDKAWQKSRVSFQDLPQRMASHRGSWVVLFLAVMSAAYLLQVGLREGFALIEGIDRFRYRLDLGNSLFISLTNNMYVFASLLGLLALNTRMRRMVIGCLLLLFVTLILFAEKFTSISMMTFHALIPAGLVYIARNGRLPTGYFISVPIGIAIVTMPLVLIVYGYLDNPDAALYRLGSRMTAQGELWWAGDRDHLELFRLEPEPIMADVATWFVPSAQDSIEVGTDFGLYYVMRPYAPSEIAYAAGVQGTGYIFSLFTYLMMTTGVAGLVIVGLAAHLTFAFTMILLMRAMRDGSILRVIFAMKLFIFNVAVTFIIGYLWGIFGIKPLAVIAVLLILERVKWSGSPDRSFIRQSWMPVAGR